MGFLDGFFEDKARKKKKVVAAPLSTDAIGRAVANASNPYGNLVGGGRNRWDVEKAVSNAYERVIWVFRCVDAIASNQASVPMYMKEYDTEAGHKIEDKVLQKLLNRKTNQFEDSWTFRYRLSSQLLLSPKGAYIELVRTGIGDVAEMYLLDPGTVDPIKDDKKYVKQYKVKRADGGVDFLDREQVIWIRIKAHPLDPYGQITPIIPAALSIETDYLARTFNKNFLKNDGRPGMLIGIDGDMSSEDADELRALFSGGYSTAGQTRVIESENIHVVDLSSRPRDVQWDEAIKSSKEDILLAFGVPESVLGNASGRCLRASESVFLATGEVKRAEELVGTKFQLIQPSRDGFKVVNAEAEYALKEKIYKITTFSGRTLETNGKHPLYMAASNNKGPFKRDIFPWGWTEMESILAHYNKNDAHGTNIFTEVAVPIVAEQGETNSLDADQYFDVGVEGEVVPDVLFTADIETQRAYISGLYSAHGLLSQHTSFDIYPPSREFAIKLQRLLLRLGVHSTVGTKKLKHVVSIGGKINMFTFLSQLEIEGENAEKSQKVWDRLSSETSREHNALRSDALPPGLVWDRVYSIEEIGEDQTVALTVLSKVDNSYLSMFWEHNTYNNADSEEENFWTKTMVPHCDAIARALEPLTNDDNDEKYITFDYETVDILQRIKRRKEDEVKQDFARGIITLNDLRVVMGLPKIPFPYADVYYHPSRIIGGDPELAAQVGILPVIGATGQPGPGMFGQQGGNPFLNQAQGGGDGQVGGTNDLVQGQLSANGSDVANQTVNDQAARTLRSGSTTGIGNGASNPNAIVEVRERIDRLLNKKSYEVKQLDTTTDPHQEFRLKTQGFIEGNLDSWSNRQLEIVKERVNHVKVRKGTRHWDGDEPVTKSLDATYVVDTDEWVDQAIEGTYFKILDILGEEGSKLVNTLKDQGVKVDITHDELLAVANSVRTYIESAARNQTELVAKHISVMDESGKSISEIQDTLTKDAFDRSRWSINLAKIVTTNAIETLYDTIYSKVDGKVYKIWCSGKDEHYRKGHGDTHGNKLAPADFFKINDIDLKYPAEKVNDEAIGCSCWLYYGIDK